MTNLTRHGRLARLGPVKPILAFVGAALAVLLVSTASVAGIAVWQIGTSFQPGVDIQSEGELPPALGPIDEPVNILLVGSDSGGGNADYGARGETLNDVTILLHISPVSHSAIAVSLQRDMYVPINGAACHGNQGTRKINEALADGGLACAVSTVESLTGLNIGYAAKIEFDGVIAMSNAVGGVEVCVAVPMHDLQIHFDLEAGNQTLQGWDALQFLRSRHGVGDGSDTTRVSNQQLFLSALIRKIKAEGTLSNPLTVYALARAAAENMQLSTSLNSVAAMAAMALAIKDIPLVNISFVLYPAGPTEVDGVGGVKPITSSAKVLTDAIAADAQIVVTGHPGGGVVGGADVVETPSPSPTNSSSPSSSSSSTPSSTPTAPPDTTPVVQLPPSINGQAATQQTCTNGNTF